MQEVHQYLDRYLEENILQSETIHRMKHVIHEFSIRAPKVLVTKCIDGRVHGSKLKGYPVTTIRFGRTDGNIVSTNLNNFWFWNRIDRLINDATCNTPNTPALFIAYMHRSDLPGLGCAAHNHDELAARKAIQEQTQVVRKIFKKDRLYVMEGITNTDSMAETLIFENGTVLDTTEFIQDFDFKRCSDIFHRSFLKYPLKDSSTARYVGFKTPEELLSEPELLFFNDFQTSLCMKTYLIREVTGIIVSDDFASQKLIQPDLFNALTQKLFSVKDLPPLLIPALLYQSVWNITYSLYHKRKLSDLNEVERWKILDHAEELICYGDGFELLQRNKAILVKTGRGNDIDALNVARKVLEKNRTKQSDQSPILIHLNIEISGELSAWEDINENISSKMNTLLRNLEQVFQNVETVVLTTYSYRDQKRFYPIHTKRDNRITYPVDILSGINSEILFSSMSLKSREALYSTERMGKFI
ncbi:MULTISPECIES: hypothetical protein [Leptospira]|uniref:Carbonic anhydrase n=2 Tax=Leptospira kirschneri TaxID=29507 RepID=A0A1T1E1K1_9LEPT|nr:MULTISPECIES: hypothetical protein [Leptospira]EJO69965.1 hypothetical protein LEP1GSC044_3124 [Leptospira kirschneri serovar Grippotyphosa str. RM52]EKO50367.1 hypothetical protein LEP1GSC131_4042 [Leptospira kirschneri str. 200802841]EKP06329.1 hypothetical protein LEP1GSC018_2196 [Leptospira kirschneri str. 2008720114]EKQ83608.1 hypothetical protein LEP1GSC064_2435 [Leptospira kirschneri serovar Grippotyphosa str. Moskva]EMJ91063.1 hypothetical protein LEP1GSC198_1640 [Leptospira kirschn